MICLFSYLYIFRHFCLLKCFPMKCIRNTNTELKNINRPLYSPLRHIAHHPSSVTPGRKHQQGSCGWRMTVNPALGPAVKVWLCLLSPSGESRLSPSSQLPSSCRLLDVKGWREQGLSFLASVQSSAAVSPGWKLQKEGAARGRNSSCPSCNVLAAAAVSLRGRQRYMVPDFAHGDENPISSTSWCCFEKRPILALVCVHPLMGDVWLSVLVLSAAATTPCKLQYNEHRIPSLSAVPFMKSILLPCRRLS